MKNTNHLDFITKKNMMLFLVGLLAIAVGFILMAQPPVDGMMSRTLAPVILIVGYLVIIPFAIMARQKNETADKA